MIVSKIKRIFASSPLAIKSFLRFIVIRPLRFYFRYFPVRTGKALVWNRVASHFWWMESYVTATTVSRTVLRVDAADIVGRYIYYFGIWEPNLTHWIQSRLLSGDTFVDVGANIGYYSLLASQCVGSNGTVIAIEALPKTAEVLAQNVSHNNAKNIRVINLAVWDKEDSLTMFTRAENPPGTTTLMDAWANKWALESTCTVQASPLSTILTIDEITRTRLIKIDVEGAEWHAIQGMKSVLQNSRNDLEIILEVNFRMLETEGKTFQDVLDFFGSWGFNPYYLENDYAAESYIAADRGSLPTRIKSADQIRTSSLDQIDVVFSRTDSDLLS